MVQTAARANRKADTEYVKLCVKLLRDRLSGKLDQKQFLEGCDYLQEVASQLSR